MQTKQVHELVTMTEATVKNHIVASISLFFYHAS